jgi:nitrogen fixation/metabolism regulation signal transduction histidine kinase
VRVVLGQEASAAIISSLMRDGVLVTIVALVLGAMASHLISRRLARGLERLLSLARETDPGSKTANPSPGMDEVGELGQAFDRLTQELHQRVHDLQAQERFLHDLMEHLPVVVLVHGADGAIQFGNPAAIALFGGTPGQILGKSLPDLAGIL